MEALRPVEVCAPTCATANSLQPRRLDVFCSSQSQRWVVSTMVRWDIGLSTRAMQRFAVAMVAAVTMWLRQQGFDEQGTDEEREDAWSGML